MTVDPDQPSPDATVVELIAKAMDVAWEVHTDGWKYPPPKGELPFSEEEWAILACAALTALQEAGFVVVRRILHEAMLADVNARIASVPSPIAAPAVRVSYPRAALEEIQSLALAESMKAPQSPDHPWDRGYRAGAAAVWFKIGQFLAPTAD